MGISTGSRRLWQPIRNFLYRSGRWRKRKYTSAVNYTILPKSQSWLWFLAPESGTVIGDTILMPERWFTLAEPERQAWLNHEYMHVRQRISWFSYLTSAAYRWSVELPAYQCQVEYLLSHGRTPRIEEWAGIMSDGYGILKWITRQEAEQILKGWIQ